MNMHCLNLVTANFWKTNQPRYRHKFQGSTKIYLSDCGVHLPHWALITQGVRSLSLGWNHRKVILGPVSDLTVFRKTKFSSKENITAGWRGGLCAAKAREAWSRHERGAPGEHQDNHRRFGIQKLYSRLAYKRQWHERKVGGWSGRAFMLLSDSKQERTDYRGWSMGCPEWYAEHQP